VRTTLTVDDDIVGILQKKAAQELISFKEVVNRTLRLGLQADLISTSSQPPFQVRPFTQGLRPGFDPDKMNQLAGELEDTSFLEKHGKSVS
jgi:hypothetical protein